MAQIDAQERVIDDHTYKIVPMDPAVAEDLLIDIIKIVGPAFGALGAGLADDRKGRSSGWAVKEMADGIFARLDKPTVRHLNAELAKATTVKIGDGWAPLSTIYAVHFRGRLDHLMRWRAFAMEVQFGGFFAVAKPALELVLEAVTAKTKTPSPSPDDTPGSGESSSPK